MDLGLRPCIVQGVRSDLRDGHEVSVRVNSIGTVVHGGNVDAIVRMLERRHIGVEGRQS